MGDPSPVAPWLLAHDLPRNADLQTDPNGDGVNLLLAYALNLDPRQNLRGSMPRPVVTANQMSLTFHAGSAGVKHGTGTARAPKIRPVWRNHWVVVWLMGSRG